MLAVIAAIENDFEREFIAEIYYNYNVAMLQKAYEIIPDREEAKEIVQEAFVKLIEKVDKLMGYTQDHIFHYAKTTVKNIALNHLKKKKTEPRKEQIPEDEDDGNFECWLADSSAIPENVYFEKEMIEGLKAVIAKLPEKEKSLLESKYILNLSDLEIAKTMNITPASVRCYLTRARRRAFAIMLKSEGAFI